MQPPARPDSPLSRGSLLGCNVVPLRPRRAHAFTVRDRIEALEWQAAAPAQDAGFVRLDIHVEQPGDGQETCDLLLLYRRDERWSRWGAVRRGERIGVWRCADGADLGRFETMRQALDALLQAERRAPGRARGPRTGTGGEARSA